MAKVVKELVTKWTYKVDTKQLVKATQNVIKLKKNILQVRKNSVAFGKTERSQLRSMGKGWKRATKEVDRYRQAKMKANRVSAGGFMGFGGGGGGRGGFFGLRGGRGGRGGSALGPGGGLAGSRFTALASIAGLNQIGRFSTLGTGGLALGAGAAFGTGKSVQLAGRKEQAQIAIGGLLGGGQKGAEGASRLLADLSDFAQKTPFQLQQLRELSATLLAGGFAANEVVDSLRTIGDVTRGDNDKLRRMLFNFVQVRTVGRATALDLRQFAMAGIPIFEALEKVTGKSGEDLEKMTRNGKITFKVIKKAFGLMTGEGGKFFRGMERQSSTLFGIFSNVEDSAAVLGEGIGDVFLNDVKALAEAFKDWLDVIKEPTVKRVMNLRNSFKQFVELVEEVDPNFDKTIGTIKAMGIALTGAFVAANPAVATFLGMLLIADDIMNGIRGNKSVSKTFMDAIEKGGFKGLLGAAVEQFTGVDTETIEAQSVDKMKQRMARIKLERMRKENAEAIRRGTLPELQRERAALKEFGAADQPLAPNAAQVGSSITNNRTGNVTLNQDIKIEGGDPQDTADAIFEKADDLKSMGSEFRNKKAN